MHVKLGKKFSGSLLYSSTLMSVLTILNNFCTVTAIVTNPPVNVRDGNIINWYGGQDSDPYTYGDMVTCPNGTFCTGFQLKLQAYSPGVDQDNTGINGIRLYCSFPGTPDESEKTIESKTGRFGSWRADHVCDGLMVGFHVRGQYFNIRPGSYEDPVGAVSFRGVCSNPETPKIQGEDLPEIKAAEYRGAPLRCLKGQAICGIQTYVGNKVVIQFGRYEEDNYQGLTRIAMKCCNIPVESEHCTPTDSWRSVLTCDNTLNTDEDSSLVCTYSLKTGVETVDTQTSENYVMASQKKDIGISVGFELSGLTRTFQTGLSKSKATGVAWSQETSKTFSEETSIDTTFIIPPGDSAELDQVVGTCDQYIVRPNVLRRTDMKKGRLGTETSSVSLNDDVLELTVNDYTAEAVQDKIRYQEIQQLKS